MITHIVCIYKRSLLVCFWSIKGSHFCRIRQKVGVVIANLLQRNEVVYGIVKGIYQRSILLQTYKLI